MKKLLILFLFVFLFFPKQVSAQVVINEFSSENSSDWIEIMNTSAGEMDLTGWIIKDMATTSVYEFSGVKLLAGELCVFGVSNRLNNGGDKIRLINGSTDIDCVAYGNGAGEFCGVSADITAPSSGETASRVPDGTGSWIIGSSSKSSTTCESLSPTPTPSPTASPTESPTEAPTSTPDPSSPPTLSPTPKPTVLSKKTFVPTSVLGDDDESGEDVVVSMREELNGKDEEEEKEPDNDGRNKKLSVVAILIIICGVGLVGVAGYSFYLQKKGDTLNNGEKSETEENS